MVAAFLCDRLSTDAFYLPSQCPNRYRYLFLMIPKETISVLDVVLYFRFRYVSALHTKPLRCPGQRSVLSLTSKIDCFFGFHLRSLQSPLFLFAAYLDFLFLTVVFSQNYEIFPFPVLPTMC